MKNLLLSILLVTTCSFGFANTIQFQSVDISTDKALEPEIFVKTDLGRGEPNIEMRVMSEGPVLPDFKATSVDNLEYSNVSEAYANSIFTEVKNITYAYLPDKATVQIREDGTARYLSISCKLERNEDTVSLSVVIMDCQTSEVYLENSYKAYFFAPNDLLRDFSASFPEECKTPVVKKYYFKPKSEGFSTEIPGTFMLDDVVYSGGGLVYDLKRTEDAPMKLIDEINAFDLRKDIECCTCLASGLIGLASLFIGAFAIPENQAGEPLWELGPVPRTFITIGIVCAVIDVVGLMAALLDLPSGTVKKLNDWAINRAHAQGMKPEKGAP